MSVGPALCVHQEMLKIGSFIRPQQSGSHAAAPHLASSPCTAWGSPRMHPWTPPAPSLKAWMAPWGAPMGPPPPALHMPAYGTRTAGVKESRCQPPALAPTPIPALRDVELPKKPPLMWWPWGPGATSSPAVSAPRPSALMSLSSHSDSVPTSWPLDVTFAQHDDSYPKHFCK